MIVPTGRLSFAASAGLSAAWTALRLLLAGLGLAGLFRPATAPIVVDNSGVFHTFGGQMIFNLSAHGPAAITAASLLLRTGVDSRTQVLDAHFQPAAQVQTQVTVDLQAQPIAPFAPVTYQWKITDASGTTLTTDEQTHIYDDNRFDWQTAARGAVQVHWHTGDLAFGQAAADMGYEALNRASRLMNAEPPAQLDIYVYDTLADLQSALQLGGRAWIGGHADPRLGVVMVYGVYYKGVYDPVDMVRLNNDLSHELIHVMVYQIVGPGYDRMPVWLDEGLATVGEPQPNPNYKPALDSAVVKDALVPVEALCAPFNIDPGRAILSYAESASLVRYLQDSAGPDDMRQLLGAYRDGATCEGGVRKVLGMSLAELQAQWEDNVLHTNAAVKAWNASLPYLLVFGPVLLVITALLFVPRRKARP